MNKLMTFIIVAMVFLAACDDEPSITYGAEQTPIETFQNQLTFSSTTVDDAEYEYGCLFQVNKDGKITKLCANQPKDGIYRVTLWDLSDSSVVVSAQVEVDSGQTSYTDITDVDVKAGEKYSVSINSEHYYIYDDSPSNNIFPATVGDISVIGYGYILTPIGMQFYDEFYSDYIATLADVVYQPIE